MDNNEFEFTTEDFTEEVSAESTTETTNEEVQPQEKELAESETKAEAKSDSTEELNAGEEAGAESPEQPAYSPNFKYSIKDEEKEFPEWLRDVVTDSQREEELRDLFTKAHGIDAIKESRTALETDFNTYKTDVETNVFPVLKTVGEFDQAVQMKDFGKAWELSGTSPDDVMDYIMMDENLSEKMYKKVLDMVQLEQDSPQAIQQKRQAYQEQSRSSQLEFENKRLMDRLNNLERNTFDQALSFAVQNHSDAQQAYDARNGQGAFMNLVNDMHSLEKNRGNELSPAALLEKVSSMIGFSAPSNVAPEMGTNMNTQEQSQVAPQELKQPKPLPNVGTGSNVSTVQKVANNWDDWEKGLMQG